MARTSEMCKISDLLRRAAKRGMRFKSSYNTQQQSGSLTGYLKGDEDVLVDDADDDMQFWVPHPKTGIYFPRGHERVMKDIPQGAAYLSQTSWVRGSDDGVENPEPDVPSF